MKPILQKAISKLLPIEYSRLDTSKNIYLTFDDGPTENTYRVLDVLEKHNVKATFFVIGDRIKRKESALEDIYCQGHMLANHSQSHKHVSKLSFSQIISEYESCDKLIGEYSVTNYIRPPFGELSINFMRYIYEYNKQVVMWNKDSRDYSAKNKHDIIANLSTLNSGDIVLFHDEFKLTTMMVDALIPYYTARGYNFSTL